MSASTFDDNFNLTKYKDKKVVTNLTLFSALYKPTQVIEIMKYKIEFVNIFFLNSKRKKRV